MIYEHIYLPEGRNSNNTEMQNRDRQTDRRTDISETVDNTTKVADIH